MSEDERPRPGLVLLLALLPVLAAYANALEVGFMWDDHMLIEQNTDLHQLHAPWAYLARSFWQHPFLHGEGHAFYRPLVTWSLALDWQWGGGGPLAFHVTNVLLHLSVCALVFGLARALGAAAPAAGVVTALFGVMPRLTESVTWVVGRTDVLAALFVLAALRLDRRTPRGRATPWLSAGLLLLGLLAKEVALSSLVIFAGASLARQWRVKDRLRRVALDLLPFGVALVAWAMLRAQVPSASAGVTLQRLDILLASFGHYLHMLLTPWNPTAQIGFVLEPEGWAQGLGLLFGAGLAATAVALGRARRPELVAWLAGAAAGVFMVCVVALAVFTIASDRFLYLPLALVAVLASQAHWGRVSLIAGVVASLGLSVVTQKRNAVWANELQFWQAAVQSSHPKNAGAFAGLGDAYFELSRLEEARTEYERAEAARLLANEEGAHEGGTVAEWLRRTDFRLALAVAESRLGEDTRAIERLEQLLAASPRWRRAAYDEVLFRARALDFTGARKALSNAREAWGEDAVLGSFSEVIATAEPVLTSSTSAALDRARAFHALGATRKAEAHYAQLLETSESRLEAARWLVIFGSEARAHRALALIANEPGAEDAFWARFPDLAPR